MGIFSSIKEAIFGKKVATPQPKKKPSFIPTEIVAVAPQPVEDNQISEVDVVANLEAIDASDGRNLHWRSSIVDLMKMLGMDASLQERSGHGARLYRGAGWQRRNEHMAAQGRDARVSQKWRQGSG